MNAIEPTSSNLKILQQSLDAMLAKCRDTNVERKFTDIHRFNARFYSTAKRNLSTIAVARSFGRATLHPLVDRQSSGVDHADNANDNKYHVKYSRIRSSRNSSIVKNGLIFD
jgi:hypothetical protein